MKNDSHEKPKRRWFQFSLRTLLIVVTLSAVPLGWLGWKLEQGHRQREAIAWVEKMGGRFGFEEIEDKSWWSEWGGKWFGESVWHVNLANTQVSDLLPLAELKNLTELQLGNTQVRDLSPLAKLVNVEWLDLDGTPVSDLSPLAEFTSLTELWLHNSPVSDEQVERLRQALPNCKIVR